MRQLGVEERRARLAARHRLLPAARTDDPAQIADDLVALHSSDPVTVYLSALARMRNPSMGAVEQALYADRSVLRHHAMRGTLWVATPPVVRRMHAAATVALVGPQRRRIGPLLATAGVADPEAWFDAAYADILAYLVQHGPRTAREVGEWLPHLRRPIDLAPRRPGTAVVAAHTRVLLLMGFEGLVLRTQPTGTWVSGAYRFAGAADWLAGGLTGVDPTPASAELADHWLRRFGPAATADLQWWTGWTLTRTKAALADCGAVPVEVDGSPCWLAKGDDESPEAEPWVAVLPSLDPTTMGWRDRSWYLPAAAAAAFDRNGNAGPTLWVDGRVVGAWAQTRDGELRHHFFETVPPTRRREVLDRLAELGGWLGGTRISVRFPGLVQAAILR